MKINEKIVESYYKNHDSFVKQIRGTLKYNKYLAEDIVQETYERALRYADSFDPKQGEFKSWFNKILFTTLRKFQLENKRQEEVKDIPDPFLSLVIPEILELIDKVENDKHKRIIFSYYILGYNSTQISNIYPDVTVSNVTTICKRFRDKLSNTEKE